MIGEYIQRYIQQNYYFLYYSFFFFSSPSDLERGARNPVE